MTVPQYRHCDRRVIADLIGRLSALRDGLPEGQDASIIVRNLSMRQIETIEECLLSQLTMLNKQGWTWFEQAEAAS